MNKTILLILDGFGIRQESHGNAVLASDMPNFEELMKIYPNTTLEASGSAVGLPKNQMGNRTDYAKAWRRARKEGIITA